MAVRRGRPTSSVGAEAAHRLLRYAQDRRLECLQSFLEDAEERDRLILRGQRCEDRPSRLGRPLHDSAAGGRT